MKFSNDKLSQYNESAVIVNSMFGDKRDLRYIASKPGRKASVLYPISAMFDSSLSSPRERYDYASGEYVAKQEFAVDMVASVSGAFWNFGSVVVERKYETGERSTRVEFLHSNGYRWEQVFDSGRANPKADFKSDFEDWVETHAKPKFVELAEAEAERAFAAFDSEIERDGKSDAERIAELEAKLEAAKSETETAREDASFEKLMKNAMISTLEPVMEAKAKEMAEKFEREGRIPTVLEIHCADKTTQVEGVTHERMPFILTLVENNIPVYLHGPAGTGKNFLAEQIAKASGREFEYMGKVDDKFTDCIGYGDANGNTHSTPLTRAAEEGKLLFIDEIDASIPEVLVTVNALLANGYMVTGWGEFLRAHEDFRVIVAGNTMGTGADTTYNGRYTLDGATLDRFAMVYLDYDRRIEESIAGKDTELVDFAHWMREAYSKNHMSHTMSYRGISMVRKMMSAGCAMDAIMTSCVIKQMNKDDVRIVKQWIENNRSGVWENKYFEAFARCCF